MPNTFPGQGISPFTASRNRWKASSVGCPQLEPLTSGDGTASGYSTYIFSRPPTSIKAWNKMKNEKYNTVWKNANI